MKLNSYIIGSDIRFEISDFDMKYEKVLKMCFYKKDGDKFYKNFPQKYPYIETIQKNFSLYGRKMFDQLGYFSNVPWDKALYEFCLIAKNENIKWWLTGSCASCLRGIEFNPHDVDIMIDSSDVNKIIDMYSEYLIEPIINTNGWLTKDFGVLFLNARIDIASDPVEELDNPVPIDCGPTARDNLEKIDWNGFKLYIPPIEYQLNANRLRKRTNRVKLIEQYMNK